MTTLFWIEVGLVALILASSVWGIAVKDYRGYAASIFAAVVMLVILVASAHR